MSSIPDAPVPAHERATPSVPVLHIDSHCVELGWRRKGELCYASEPCEGADNEVLVAAATKLLSEAKLGGKPLVLCLASGAFESHQLLLSDMSEDETRAVLSRKSANSLRVAQDEALFWAQPCGTPLADTKSTQTTWILHSRKYSEHYDLLLRMRRAGIQVRRVVAAREVITHILDGVSDGPGNILLTTTGRAVYAHLFRGLELVQESRLPLGDFDNRAETYVSIVQDVRQLAAFWSQGSRGAPLEAVHLSGFSAAEVEKMRTPLGIAAQGADLVVAAYAKEETLDAVRRNLLEVLMAHASKARDLRLQLPPRRSRLVALAAVLTMFAAAGAWKLREHWGSRIELRTAAIERQLEGTENVDDDDSLRNEFLAARSSLGTTITSLDSLSERGMQLDDVLRQVYGTLGRVADVSLLSFTETEGGTEVVMEASLADDLDRAARRLEQLRRAAQADTSFADVAIEPSSRVPDAAQGEKLSFTFTGLYLRGDA